MVSFLFLFLFIVSRRNLTVVTAATFGDGTKITSKVNPNDQVQKAQLYTKVGEATINGRGVDVKKDRIRVLYSNDGWDYQCIYWAD